MASDKAVASLTILPSEARQDAFSQEFVNDQFRGGDFFIRQTGGASTASFVSVKLQGKVPGSTEWYTVATVAPATSTAFTKRLRVYPGASTALNSTGLDPTVQNDFLPGIWRIASTNVGTTGTVTWACSAHLFA